MDGVAGAAPKDPKPEGVEVEPKAEGVAVEPKAEGVEVEPKALEPKPVEVVGAAPKAGGAAAPKAD